MDSVSLVMGGPLAACRDRQVVGNCAGVRSAADRAQIVEGEGISRRRANRRANELACVPH